MAESSSSQFNSATGDVPGGGRSLKPLGIQHPLLPHQGLGQTVPRLQFMVPLGTRSLSVLDPSIFSAQLKSPITETQDGSQDLPFPQPDAQPESSSAIAPTQPTMQRMSQSDWLERSLKPVRPEPSIQRQVNTEASLEAIATNPPETQNAPSKPLSGQTPPFQPPHLAQARSTDQLTGQQPEPLLEQPSKQPSEPLSEQLFKQPSEASSDSMLTQSADSALTSLPDRSSEPLVQRSADVETDSVLTLPSEQSSEQLIQRSVDVGTVVPAPIISPEGWVTSEQAGVTRDRPTPHASVAASTRDNVISNTPNLQFKQLEQVSSDHSVIEVPSHPAFNDSNLEELNSSNTPEIKNLSLAESTPTLHRESQVRSQPDISVEQLSDRSLQHQLNQPNPEIITNLQPKHELLIDPVSQQPSSRTESDLQNTQLASDQSSDRSLQRKLDNTPSEVTQNSQPKDEQFSDRSLQRQQDQITSSLPQNSGVVEFKDEWSEQYASERPLNPPTLGDFEPSVAPQDWGVGGQIHPSIQQHQNLQPANDLTSDRSIQRKLDNVTSEITQNLQLKNEQLSDRSIQHKLDHTTPDFSQNSQLTSDQSSDRSLQRKLDNTPSGVTQNSQPKDEQFSDRSLQRQQDQITSSLPQNSGVVEFKDEWSEQYASERPLNPPTLGDFEPSVAPQDWGVGGQIHPSIQQHQNLQPANDLTSDRSLQRKLDNTPSEITQNLQPKNERLISNTSEVISEHAISDLHNSYSSRNHSENRVDDHSLQRETDHAIADSSQNTSLQNSSFQNELLKSDQLENNQVSDRSSQQYSNATKPEISQNLWEDNRSSESSSQLRVDHSIPEARQALQLKHEQSENQLVQLKSDLNTSDLPQQLQPTNDLVSDRSQHKPDSVVSANLQNLETQNEQVSDRVLSPTPVEIQRKESSQTSTDKHTQLNEQPLPTLPRVLQDLSILNPLGQTHSLPTSSSQAGVAAIAPLPKSSPSQAPTIQTAPTQTSVPSGLSLQELMQMSDRSSSRFTQSHTSVSPQTSSTTDSSKQTTDVIASASTQTSDPSSNPFPDLRPFATPEAPIQLKSLPKSSTASDADSQMRIQTVPESNSGQAIASAMQEHPDLAASTHGQNHSPEQVEQLARVIYQLLRQRLLLERERLGRSAPGRLSR